MEELRELLQEALNKKLYQITVSSARHTDGAMKRKILTSHDEGTACFSGEQLCGKTGFS